MSQSGRNGSSPDDDDILSAIRRIVDEEQHKPGADAAPAAPTAGVDGDGQGAAAPARSTLVLTPTMRVNRPAAEDDDALPPLRLVRRVDPGAAEAASIDVDPAPAGADPFEATPEADNPVSAPMGALAPEAARTEARQLRAAFGRDDAAVEPPYALRLRPAEEPVENSGEDAGEAAMLDQPAAAADPAPVEDAPQDGGFGGAAPAASEAELPPAWVSAALGADAPGDSQDQDQGQGGDMFAPAAPQERTSSWQGADPAMAPGAASDASMQEFRAGWDAAAPTSPEPAPSGDDVPLVGAQGAAGQEGAGGLSRDELEALIAERIRSELTGEFGARISANIRTLVQREVAAEVARALQGRSG